MDLELWLRVEQLNQKIIINVLKLVIESTVDQESKEAQLGGEHMKKEI